MNASQDTSQSPPKHQQEMRQMRSHGSLDPDHPQPQPEQRAALRKPQYDSEDSNVGCFGFFKKRRDQEESAQQSEKRPITQIRSNESANRPNEPRTIRPGGGGIVPAIDAPISAVNAGDRRVLIECGKSSIFLPVTPTTTPRDLMRSASTTLSEPINVESSVLLEHFGKVGVQRPLRNYEHIRDVMNSWDDDKQNALILVDRSTLGYGADLSAKDAPLERPAQSEHYMYYSQKVGKWDKRLITVRADGQVLLTRSGQTSNVCHLSDFDIHIPTPKQLSRKIKPPKKYCYAIKSQQKTSMFESTSNFVHFFSVGDKAAAESFYAAVHRWRSWYLVNVMGEGRKAPAAKPPDSTATETKYSHMQPMAPTGVLSAGPPAQLSHQNHQSKAPPVDSHHQPGSFKPLLSRFDDHSSSPNPAMGLQNGTVGPALQHRPSVRNRSHRPISPSPITQLEEDEPLANLATKRQSVDHASPEPESFMTGGLLGRSYSQRQRHQLEREVSVKHANPFINGPTLLNRDDTAPAQPRCSVDGDAYLPGRSTSVRRNPSTRKRERGSVEIGRSASQRARELHKPLVDLTPQYREPPQHVKKGKGFHPDQIGLGGLIENATSPENAIEVPPAIDWRGRNAAHAPSHVNEGRVRSRSRPTREKSVKRPTTAGASSDQPVKPFAPSGMLANAQIGQGDVGTGHGVLSGAHARGPLLDLNEESRYAPGSLLHRVEQVEGPPRPVIDRE
ncbi:hypothetical protein LTR66_008745 [Elasticomyces elasticus]|nr:hypothetical protein LTR66_008745 [Elasticomyces elasticus]